MMDGLQPLEPRLLLSSSPLVYDGFDADQYTAGTQLDGSSPVVAGFDGIWAGSGSASIESGSLLYSGFGAAGENRVQLNGSITVSRELALDPGDPLANYIDGNGDIGASLDGSALYLSVLMQVDGASPPTSTFSLYNDGTSSSDREFRIVYSGSNSSFQAIAGPSGSAVNLDPLNNGTNLFVIKIDFAAGNDTISLWQNPAAGLSEAAPDAVIANYNIAFDRVAFSRFAGTGSTQFDELRLGDTWSAVTDEAALDLILQPPISADGFNSTEYANGASIDGIGSYIAGYDGAWSSLGSTTIEPGSLSYAGLGNAGSNRVQLNGTDVVSRLMLNGNNGPLANYLDTNGDVGASADGSSLYLSMLMKVDGSTPPNATFSLYNDGITAGDRSFRILYSSSNANFTMIAGPDGDAVALDALNNGTNLFVIRIDFAEGNDTISVWQNPVAGDLEPTPDAQITDYDIAFDRLAFTRYSGVGTVQFDEVRIGHVWSAVTDQAALGLLPGPQTIFAMQEAPPSPTGDGMYPAGFFPFIDAFGQYRYMDWDDKIHSVDELIQSAADEAAELAANPGPSDLNQYGGWLAGPQLEATGYFRTEKVNGKWWLVDPDGRLFFSNGITGVSDPDREDGTGVAVKTGVTGRENYFADLPEAGDPAAQFLAVETSIVTSGDYQGSYPLAMNFFAANALTKYGDDWEADSQDIAHDRLKSWGMNTIGGWSDEDVYLQDRTAYTIVLFPTNPSLINGNGTYPDYFDPQYLINVKARINQEAGKSLNDPYNLGYFIHNELSWTRSTTSDTDIALETLAAAPTQHAKIAFREQLMDKYGTIEALNAQWQTNYTSWVNFLDKRNAAPNLTGADADLRAFDVLYANQYFSTTQQGMREAAPNHLYLGARFTGGVRVAPAQAAVQYADVISINRYGPDVSVLPAGLEGDVPLISGEYHYSANDTGLLSDGLKTATDQADRADKFATYLQSALNDNRYVGVHWLQYWDFPAAGKLNSNNNNSNLGFVSITDTPYTEMVDAARTVGASLYETRVGDFGFVVDRTLYINGTEAADQIELQSGAASLMYVTRNGVDRSFALNSFDDVIVSGGYGDDTLAIDGMAGKALTVRGAEAGDSVNVIAGNFDLSIEAEATGPALMVGSFGTVRLSTGVTLTDLDNQGQIDLVSQGATPGVLITSALTLGPAAVIDLANNGLVIDYAGASPLISIQSSVTSAYNAGNWDGVGITTSYGNATQSAVGYGESADVLGPGGGVFMGRVVDGTAVLVRHTLYGDANLSGSVDGSDFNRWNTNRNTSGNWTQADFNYDGLVNQSDLDLWSANRFTRADSVPPPTPPVVDVSSSSSEPKTAPNTGTTGAVVAEPEITVKTNPTPAADQTVKHQPRQQTQQLQQPQTQSRQQQPVTANVLARLAGMDWARLVRHDPFMMSWNKMPALQMNWRDQSSGGLSRNDSRQDTTRVRLSDTDQDISPVAVQTYRSHPVGTHAARR